MYRVIVYKGNCQITCMLQWSFIYLFNSCRVGSIVHIQLGYEYFLNELELALEFILFGSNMLI